MKFRAVSTEKEKGRNGLYSGRDDVKAMVFFEIRKQTTSAMLKSKLTKENCRLNFKTSTSDRSISLPIICSRRPHAIPGRSINRNL